jgi:hypothetical protein
MELSMCMWNVDLSGEEDVSTVAADFFGNFAGRGSVYVA